MGGGDLNMKKSWHPLLLKNQERVWLEEKKALEEKKKLDQLRKEKEEERQLQELQRLQEEQTGKKRSDKLEWMYTTPASGSTANPNDLEDYLLGKKRVDKILTADENAKLGASHKNFIAVQNANNARDIQAKIREDPLLAIKQQEQAAYDALMSNPLRLKEMQLRNGIVPKKEKEEKRRHKEEKRRKKEERRRRRELEARHSRSPSPDLRRSLSPRRRYDDNDDYRMRDHYDGSYRRRDSRQRSPPRPHSQSPPPRRHNPDEFSSRPEDSKMRISPQHGTNRKRPRSPSRKGDRSEPVSYDKRARRESPPRDRHNSTTDDRAARLAAMSKDASVMSVERRERLEKMLEKEKAELEEDERLRAKSKGMVGFLSQEQKKVFGGERLEDRIRRGRGGLVVERD